MLHFKFFQIPNTKQWVILDPKRGHRPHTLGAKDAYCPFCPTNILKEHNELYRVGGEKYDENWQLLVVPNKFPFAPIHEVVIHTREHKTMKELTLDEYKSVIGAYVNRYNEHCKKGAVSIFANSGHDAGESINHAHSQIAVVPEKFDITVPRLEEDLSCYGECISVDDYILMCPPYSQWPDEVWIVPKERQGVFGDIRYEQVESLAFVLKRLITILDLRHGDGNNFPFNYYIYPFNDWYLRLLPRAKVPGGFEMATGIFVNTQDPKETIEFIKEHFMSSKEEVIKNKAEYRRGV